MLDLVLFAGFALICLYIALRAALQPAMTRAGAGRRTHGIYMRFIYPGHSSAVEFLRGSGPLSPRYEIVPSLFLALCGARPACGGSSP